MRVLLLLLGFLSVSAFAFRDCPVASFYPSFVGNVTLDNGFDFDFRSQYSATLNIPTVFGVGALDSYAVGTSSSKSKLDVSATRLVAHVGMEQAFTAYPPIVAYAYFDDSSRFNASGSADFNNGIYSTAAAIFFGSVFEYADLNGNGVYDKSDKIVQSISLTQQAYDFICSNVGTGKVAQDTITSFNVTTRKSSLLPLPGVPYLPFSVQVRVADVVGVSSQGDVMAPKFSKIDLSVSDFPYVGFNGTNNTYLAISTFFLAAEFNASFSFDMNGQQIQGGTNDTKSQLTFAWDSSASSDLGDLSVKASSFGAANITTFPGFIFDIFFKATAKASLDAKEVIYSFSGQYQPNRIYWDPTLGAGPVPKVSSNNGGNSSSDDSNTGLWIGVGVGAGVGLLIVVGLVFWCIRSKNRASNEKQHLIGSADEYPTANHAPAQVYQAAPSHSYQAASEPEGEGQAFV